MQITLSLLPTPWKNVEGGYGEEWAESEPGEDQDHDRWYRPCPTTELREVPMCHLQHRCRQQQY